MKKYIKYNQLILVQIVFIFCSCDLSNVSTEKEVISIEKVKIDYESDRLVKKFNTIEMGMSDTISYEQEIDKIKRLGKINYSALDSLFQSGTDINEAFIKERSGGGFGFGFSFSVKGGFSKSTGAGSTREYETNAIEIALKEYKHSIDFGSTRPKSFDLIHFLLSRGVNPNAEGKLPLFGCIKDLSNTYIHDTVQVCRLLDIYKFYGFDMKNLDLSASNGTMELFELLVDEGSIHYNMNEFNFESELREIYNEKESLEKKGIIFNFSEIDGQTFPFESDTVDLLMMLEMGLSPYHITPEGNDLRSDFGSFCDSALIRTIDQYRIDYPNQK
jgi:hypothetical protein